MAKKPIPMTAAQRAQTLAELRRDVAKQRKGYRARALEMFPHICASCAREFSATRLKELTVHHKDHNHDNNPPDGSNWELLCIYCHDHEHEKSIDAKHMNVGASSAKMEGSPFGDPFAALGSMLGAEETEADSDEPGS